MPGTSRACTILILLLLSCTYPPTFCKVGRFSSPFWDDTQETVNPISAGHLVGTLATAANLLFYFFVWRPWRGDFQIGDFLLGGATSAVVFGVVSFAVDNYAAPNRPGADVSLIPVDGMRAWVELECLQGDDEWADEEQPEGPPVVGQPVQQPTPQSRDFSNFPMPHFYGWYLAKNISGTEHSTFYQALDAYIEKYYFDVKDKTGTILRLEIGGWDMGPPTSFAGVTLGTQTSEEWEGIGYMGFGRQGKTCFALKRKVAVNGVTETVRFMGVVNYTQDGVVLSSLPEWNKRNLGWQILRGGAAEMPLDYDPHFYFDFRARPSVSSAVLQYQEWLDATKAPNDLPQTWDETEKVKKKPWEF